jgi:hypothetical protein
MMVRYLDPRVQPAEAPQAYRLFVGDEPLTIGLLANGFADSVEFLDMVADEMSVPLTLSRRLRYNKRNWSQPAGDELLDEVAQSCGAVIAAFGH